MMRTPLLRRSCTWRDPGLALVWPSAAFIPARCPGHVGAQLMAGRPA